MIDFAQGIDTANSLLEQTLAKAVMSCLVIPSGLVEDLKALRLQLTSVIGVLSAEELVPLFTLSLYLNGYRVTREDTCSGRRFWVTEVQNPDGVVYFGIAALVDKPDDLVYYQDCMIRLGFVSGVLCMIGTESVANPLPNAIVLTGRSYISQSLFILAVHQYVENVMEIAVATGANPSFRQALQAVLMQDPQLTGDTITATSKRWATLLGSRTQ